MRILTNGEEYPLADRDLKLFLHDPMGKKIEMKFVIEDVNCLSFAYPGISQRALGVWRKDELISGLIKAKYISDIMDAVRNNYELVRDGTAGDKTQEYTDEYLAMQEWRCYAKELANEIFEEYERQNG